MDYKSVSKLYTLFFVRMLQSYSLRLHLPWNVVLSWLETYVLFVYDPGFNLNQVGTVIRPTSESHSLSWHVIVAKCKSLSLRRAPNDINASSGSYIPISSTGSRYVSQFTCRSNPSGDKICTFWTRSWTQEPQQGTGHLGGLRDHQLLESRDLWLGTAQPAMALWLRFHLPISVEYKQ